MSEGLSRNDHPETSKEAAKAISKKTVADRARIERHLKGLAPEGASDRDLQDWLEMGSSTERPRRVELVRAGIVKAGPRRKQHGRMVIRWVWVPPAERLVVRAEHGRTNRLREALNLVEHERDEARDRIDKALALMDAEPGCTRTQVRAILESSE